MNASHRRHSVETDRSWVTSHLSITHHVTHTWCEWFTARVWINESHARHNVIYLLFFFVIYDFVFVIHEHDLIVRYRQKVVEVRWLDRVTSTLKWDDFDRKNPPLPGGCSIYYFPWSRAVCKRFHDEMRRSHLVVKSLTHGSWSGNIVNRTPPRGGGFLSINLIVSLPRPFVYIWRLNHVNI